MAIKAQLLDNLNPELAVSLRKQLPLLSIQSHAIVAGQQIYFPTRLILNDPAGAFTEPLNEQPLGRINFEPFFQYVSLNYGPVSEAVPAWPLAQVLDSDLQKLDLLGRRIWDSFLAGANDLVVVVEHADELASDEQLSGADNPHRSSVILPANATWQDVLASLESEIDAIWVNEPEDVRALRLGIQTSDAGLNGQYFSPWVMASGLVRSMAIVELATLQRLSHSTSFGVSHLQRILHEILGLQLGVIGYFGLPQLSVMLQAVDRTVDQIEEKQEFQALITALFTYVNRYNLWLYHTFPWYLGRLFPKATVDKASAILELSSQPPYLSRSRANRTEAGHLDEP
jgi:hypothetical protein